MYALKTITVAPDGRQLEVVRVLGNWYALEQFAPNQKGDLAARIEYLSDGNIHSVDIQRSDEGYITTLNGDTVRHVCRGDLKAREQLMSERRSAS
ncbi:hypothetical protein P2G74_01470 [Cronobacter muytjensii]|uniref:hypothetical protein n=1 Tax=Cronobacter muytjensii TaxID=413501 RepID=UPI002DB78234|nr:hypothetical protein [Cronobacter muytjensii]MEB8638642.1 hypothetical protein [Cronobacter muytjensii]